MPKWRARQVTVSPSFMTPLVTPPTARSPDLRIEAAWASTDSEQAEAVAGRRSDHGLEPDTAHRASKAGRR
jgi:hypothetical protein